LLWTARIAVDGTHLKLPHIGVGLSTHRNGDATTSRIQQKLGGYARLPHHTYNHAFDVSFHACSRRLRVTVAAERSC